MKKNVEIPIAFITDNSFVMQTYVAAMSVLHNKNEETAYIVYVVSPEMSEKEFEVFKGLENEGFRVELVRGDMARFDHLHKASSSVSYISASKAALLKFDLPNLLPQIDKLLYLDGDIIVRGDLSELYGIELGENYVAAAHETGKMYFKSPDVKRYPGYFNSGVMLLNLKKMRQDDITNRLIEVKRNLTGQTLMDQPVFNNVFENHTLHIDSKWNYLALNLRRARDKWTIEQFNELCGTSYSSKEDLDESAVIIHYSSKEKPWKCHVGELTDMWYEYYSRSPWKMEKLYWQRPKVSVIVPVYNGREYFEELLKTLRNQSLTDIEMIFIDDCGHDGAFALAEEAADIDSRIILLRNEENRGPGYSRNRGISVASGQYIAFCDGDDFMTLDYYKLLYDKATATGAAVVKGSRADYFADGTRNRSSLNQTIVKRLEKGVSPMVAFTYEHTTAIYRTDRVRKTKACNGDCFQDEDTIFLMYFLHGMRKDELAIVDDAVYFYRRHEESVTSWKDADYLEQCRISCQIKIEALLDMEDSAEVREYAAAVLENRIYSRMLMCHGSSISRCDKELYLKAIIDMLRQFATMRPSTVFGRHSSLVLKNDWDESSLYDYLEESQRKTKEQRSKETLSIQRSNLTSRLMYKYRILQLKKMLSFGKRRRKYKEKIRELRTLLREYRYEASKRRDNR